MSSPVAHSGIAPGWCEHPNCSADTTKEPLGAALAQLQLAQADPASLRAPTLPIRFICSPQPLCRAAQQLLHPIKELLSNYYCFCLI